MVMDLSTDEPVITISKKLTIAWFLIQACMMILKIDSTME
jgi:hypothetical protein